MHDNDITKLEETQMNASKLVSIWLSCDENSVAYFLDQPVVQVVRSYYSVN